VSLAARPASPLRVAVPGFHRVRTPQVDPHQVAAIIRATAGLRADPAPLPDGLRFYDLRHTCASLLIAQGASVKAVQAQLGHTTASITLDTYGHLFPSEMDTFGDRLELVRDAAVARLGRTQHGPADSRLSETARG
jgi:integrase